MVTEAARSCNTSPNFAFLITMGYWLWRLQLPCVGLWTGLCGAAVVSAAAAADAQMDSWRQSEHVFQSFEAFLHACLPILYV